MLIDVSHYQGTINWGATGVEGAYIKVTEGTASVDPMWQANHDGARAAGKLTGAYHFADLGDPIAEANHFADIFLQTQWQLRPVLDIETAGATAGWVNAFRTQFRARVPDPRFRVYSSLSLLTGALNPAAWIDPLTDIWAARYNTVLGWNHPQLVLWQNTSAATIPGVLGHVDTDQYMNGWTPAHDSLQEVDMQLTDQIPTPIGTITYGQFIAGVWQELKGVLPTRATLNVNPANKDTLFGRAADADGNSWDAKQLVIALAAKVDALSAAVAALGSAQSGVQVTQAEVIAAIEQAVEKTVTASGSITVAPAAPSVAPVTPPATA